MKGWELSFDEKTLESAEKCNVNIVHAENREIIAQIDGIMVEASIAYHTPHPIFCQCESNYSCKHEAALMLYLENHMDLLEDREIDIDLIDSNKIKEFLKKELDKNFQLKKDFVEEFAQKSPIDKQYYLNKLNEVFRSGEGRDFKYHGIHDIDLMAYGLSEFMADEIPKILDAYEHGFACEIIEMISQMLSDDLAVSHNSWYELVEELLECVYILTESIYLSENERELLENSMEFIKRYL